MPIPSIRIVENPHNVPVSPGRHDFSGACAPYALRHATSAPETFSVGIFMWVAKTSSKGCKRSKVKVRVVGLTVDPEPVYEKAREIALLLDVGQYKGPTTVNVHHELPSKRSFPVTDPTLDTPDGAVVDGYERVGERTKRFVLHRDRFGGEHIAEIRDAEKRLAAISLDNEEAVLAALNHLAGERPTLAAMLDALPRLSVDEILTLRKRMPAHILEQWRHSDGAGEFYSRRLLHIDPNHLRHGHYEAVVRAREDAWEAQTRGISTLHSSAFEALRAADLRLQAERQNLAGGVFDPERPVFGDLLPW